ncbi:tetratricopeptide repeat protein [Polynucleobacter sp.]|jgi:predicted O-linked N-acetylglucosamine transferase (SPINDLY family)|uniref:O-linked N-acetylglucosamine transferase, SPINDLY family protein n=1 Tax=Polynucleobacter sp. TaxID=2029855 RepID=UPI0037C699C3
MIDELGFEEFSAKVRSLEHAGQINEALDAYRLWLRKNPNLPVSFAIWFEYGRTLLLSGSLYQAENAFKAVLEQKPDFPEALMGLGSALEAQGKIDEAISTWQGGLRSEDIRVGFLNNIARVSDGRFSHEQTESVLLQSLYIKPGQPEVLSTLLNVRQKLCQWPIFTKELPVSIEAQKEIIGPLASLALVDDPISNLESAKRFIKLKQYEGNFKPLLKKTHRYAGHKKIRLGFVSSDFRLHATSIFYVQLLEKLNRDHFEVYGFDITTINFEGDYMRPRLLQALDHHIDLRALSDEHAANKIQELEIDVLIDLTGLTSSARPGIILRRPAPIQVAYLGFIASSAISTVDYVITTPDLFKGADAGFTEKPLFLSGVFATIDDQSPKVAHLTRQSQSLPENAFVFCALLNPYKITQSVYESWMRILVATPGSVLWLIADTEKQKQNLIDYAKGFDVNADRLIFTSRIQPSEYRASLGLADLFLDTAPYGNGATAHDAIVANLPMLTCPGNTMMSRLTAHFMRAMALDDLVATSWADYEARAIDLASNPEKLVAYRQAILDARKSSAVFNQAAFAEDFGRAILGLMRSTK